nr:acrosin inhibitor isoform [swine, sperm, Peptide Partial, 12 aa] [Sus scrofa]
GHCREYTSAARS